jgi:Tfp pilus assembly protein PilV
VAYCTNSGTVHEWARLCRVLRNLPRRPPVSDRGPSRGRGDDGITLIEVVIASVILSTVVLGLVTGIMTAVKASDLHRREARSEVAMRQYVESIEAGAYIPCPTATPALYSAYGTSTIDTYQLSVTAVDAWSANSNPVRFTNGCTSEAGAERLTIHLEDPAGKVSKDVNIVVRSSS